MEAPDPLLFTPPNKTVCAVGVNFRDVLNVLGMYPGDPGMPGGDCAGIVTACSSAPSAELHGSAWRPAVGDRVFGLAAGCLGSHIVTSDLSMVPCPEQVGPLKK
mmetsp:Transcript_19843/g.47328  ORF Transcript_19843/g.47328 Transcript_19843/m.47328 type:complete len:104 (-) Transcript_19843:263-574(-)